MATRVSRYRQKKRLPAYKRRQRLSSLLTHMVLIAGGFLWVYPFLWVFSSSLRKPEHFFTEGLNLIPKELALSNYVNTWNDASFGAYFFNSVFTTVLTVVLTLFVTSMAGFVLARKTFPGKRAIIVLVGITLFLPHGYTIIPIFDIMQRLGLLDTLWSIVIAETAGGLVFSTFLFMGYFSTMDRQIEDAARVDGAGFHQLYWRVLFPLAGPMVATVALFTFISSWNNFLIPLVFTLGRPDLNTLAIGLYSFIGEHSTNWTYVCAGSVITLGPIMLIFVLLQRYFIDGVSGAVKA
ncbi:carbohydrate ABC transporter permease [Tengunoibacter tsumagoiensis]|uniref:Sugar ABC transporter permease n=1 Tax=Tengunoibacter tsumagoiensis TaxID=2014871 RepID=A0A402A7K2_9CHLR|nr:carbohydrate ABC transporter permease [Tengunoibacter tsumagoiensis]GCE15134.1 sugar ABC transporter permease [Tengunoibacter tsumagoiensis]